MATKSLLIGINDLESVSGSIYNAKILLPNRDQPVGTGWLPPLPSLQVITEEDESITRMSRELRIERGSRAVLPEKVTELTKWCSPVEDQGQLGSCTAHAGVGVIEYFERRASGDHVNASRLFLYKVTRALMGLSGDTGAWLRDTMAAMALLGVPPEKYWPYLTRQDPGPAGERTFDTEPPPFVYAMAARFSAIEYFSHDPRQSVAPELVSESVRRYLAAGIPAMFGFTVFDSMAAGGSKGAIPYPGPKDKVIGGHAIVAIGYDNHKKITNTRTGTTTTGALQIRNSWGAGWGDQGYGWLPYDYILNKLAMDFWSVLRMDWISTQQFGL